MVMPAVVWGLYRWQMPDLHPHAVIDLSIWPVMSMNSIFRELLTVRVPLCMMGYLWQCEWSEKMVDRQIMIGEAGSVNPS